MPPDFGDAYSVDFSGIPPHMSAVDFVLWQRLRRRGPLPFVRLYFDVAVGRGAVAGGEVPEAVRVAWDRITKQRIDVVGERLNEWTLYEIRGAAGPGAVGSLIVYRDLWASDPPDSRPVRLVLVTDIFSENLQESLKLASIELVLV